MSNFVIVFLFVLFFGICVVIIGFFVLVYCDIIKFEIDFFVLLFVVVGGIVVFLEFGQGFVMFLVLVMFMLMCVMVVCICFF